MSLQIIEAIKAKALEYPDVEEGQSCSQSAFKIRGKAFLYIGMQGGRGKAMFKLKPSKQQALILAQDNPDDFQLGSTSWVTARFTDEEPMATDLWEQWLQESYELTC